MTRHKLSSALLASGAFLAPGVAMAEAGLPQLDTSTYASQVFWLAVSFAVLYVLMSRIALPRMEEVLELRKTQKSNALNHAEQLNVEAERLRKTYEASLAKAHGGAQDALNSAEQDIRDKMDGEYARFSEQARNRSLAAEKAIQKARSEALQSLTDISSDLAVDIVQKVAGIAVGKAEAKKIVASLMQKTGT